MVKNYNRTNRLALSYITIFLVFLISQQAEAQAWITWTGGGSGVNGTFPGGTVSVTQSGAGNNITFNAPAWTATNLTVTGANTFSTSGPAASPPSKRVTFTFSTPVIITKYNMADIDRGGWNDTFSFSGITFTSVTAVNCAATTTGVTATTDVGSNAEYARWVTSTVPVTSFSIDYAVTSGRTHAYLAYAIEVSLPTSTPTVTVNSPIICGTEMATITATPGTPGSYSYAWTVPVGVANPGNVASFTTNVTGTYSVIITDLVSGNSSTSSSGTVSVGPNQTPTFTQIAPICSGDALSLPSTSDNGITGIWSPAIDNTQTTTYTFTPISNPCANPATMTVVVTPRVTPSFTQVADICSGEFLADLPTTSDNGIAGFWSPSMDNTQTTTYTFTPTGNPCANTQMMTIVVNPRITPTFTQVAAICSGDLMTALPTTSSNGIIGSWSPALNNTETTVYTFTPALGICASPTTMTIVVNPKLTPAFTQIGPVCFGNSIDLPTISSNGVNGIWSPSVNNTATTSYTFTPDSGECAFPTTMEVVVFDDFSFDFVSGCENNDFLLKVIPQSNSFDENTASYNWTTNSTGIGNNSPILNVTAYLNSTAVTETLPITFEVVVTDSNGCQKTKNITLDNVYCGIQNGISPNGDNINEFFDLRLLDVSQLHIFNRYGVKVYDKDNYTQEWVGQTNSGQLLPTGTYYYLIEFKNNTPLKSGWIYINREIK